VWRETGGAVGIPCFVLEDGSVTLSPEEAGLQSRPPLDRSGFGVRYSLIVSIETPESDVDIYTPVSTMVAAAAEIEMQR